MTHLLFSPRFRLCAASVSLLLAVAVAALVVRFRLYHPHDLVTAIVVGVLWGVVTFAGERLSLQRHRASLLAFHRASLRERLCWPVQRKNLQTGGWYMATLLLLLLFCRYRNQVLLAFFSLSLGLVGLVGNIDLAASLYRELKARGTASSR